jgi:hypothetical protein
MDIFPPEIGVTHHAISGILFVSGMLTHKLPDGFQRVITDISKRERSVSTRHHFPVRSDMYPASARKTSKKARTHEIWKCSYSGTSS